MWIIVQLALSFGLISVITSNMLAGAILGLVLTFNISRGVYLTQNSLHKLNQTLTFKPHVLLPFDPVNRLLSRLNQLAQHDTGSLREELIEQTRSVAAQEERNRMARELHDSIKQQLFSINISSGAAMVQLEQNPAKASAALQDVRLSVKAAMAEMNALLQQLSPAPLEKVGLEQAIRDQAEALAYRTGAQVSVEFEALPTEASLRTGTQDALFRIVQEALSNVARHARADKVQVRLRTVEEHIELVIEDDGQGFAKKSAGMGLTNMHERVQALDGHIVIQSKPGQGTTVHASIPFNIDLQEEIMIDHTVNRIFFVGLVGSLLLTIALFVPLFFIVPGFYLDDWFIVSSVNSWTASTLSTIGSLVILLGCGWFGARFGRANTTSLNLMFGAIAGGVAAGFAYLLIGASAFGVVGTQDIIRHGYQAADNEEHMMRLLYDTVGETLIWGYIDLWVTLLVGIGIGALGGLLNKQRLGEFNDHALRLARTQMLFWSLLSSGFNLAFGYLVFASLYQIAHNNDTYQELATLTRLGSMIAIITVGAFFTIPLLGALEFQRQDLRKGHYLAAFYDGNLFGAIALIGAWIMLSGKALSLMTAMGVSTWLIGMLLLVISRRASRREMVKAQAHKMQPTVTVASFVLILPILMLVLWGWIPMFFTYVAFLVGIIGSEILKTKPTLVKLGIGLAILAGGAFMIMGWPLYSGVALFLISGVLTREIVVVGQGFRNEPTVIVNKSIWQTHIGSLLGSTTLITFNSMLSIVPALPLVIIVVPSIMTLVTYEEDTVYQSSTTMEMSVQTLYLIQAQSVLMGFGISLGIMGIVTLVMFAVRRWQMRSSAAKKGLIYDTSRLSG